MTKKSFLSDVLFYSTRPNLVFLTLSAIGSLGLAGYGTFKFFENLGTGIALAAVVAIEASIPGVIFTISTKMPKHIAARSIVKTIEWIVISVSLLFALVMSAAANFLYKADIVNVAVGEGLRNWLQLGVLAGFLPLLAIISIERLRVAFSIHKAAREEAEKPAAVVVTTRRVSRDKRRKELKAYMKSHNGKTPDVDTIAAHFNVSKRTIERDIVEMENEF